MNITDRRQTDGRQHIANVNVSSRSLKTVSTKKHILCCPAVPDKPGVPQLTDVKDGSMTVTWTPPDSDGGAPITGYVLEYRSEASATWKKATEKALTELKFAATGLNETEMYEFRVAAVNKAGNGPYSDNSAPTKAKEVLGKRNVHTVSQPGFNVASKVT